MTAMEGKWKVNTCMWSTGGKRTHFVKLCKNDGMKVSPGREYNVPDSGPPSPGVDG